MKKKEAMTIGSRASDRPGFRARRWSGAINQPNAYGAPKAPKAAAIPVAPPRPILLDEGGGEYAYIESPESVIDDINRRIREAENKKPLRIGGFNLSLTSFNIRALEKRKQRVLDHFGMREASGQSGLTKVGPRE